MKGNDRRVQRTHQLLRGALVALIQEKGFEALTVQDIIDRANVGRATFYAHFDNKEDLLVSGLEEFRASIREQQRRRLREKRSRRQGGQYQKCDKRASWHGLSAGTDCEGIRGRPNPNHPGGQGQAKI